MITPSHKTHRDRHRQLRSVLAPLVPLLLVICRMQTPSHSLRHHPLLALCLPLALVGTGFGDCGRSSPLECSTHSDCPQTQICTPNRRCTPKIAECATDRECGILYRCEHFDCVPLDACRSDFDCSPPDRCLREHAADAHGVCERPRECPHACPAQHYCGADLRCIPDGACGSDKDCVADTQCDHGHCRIMHCTQDSDCQAPRICESVRRGKVCKLPTRCRYDQDCPRDKECRQKTCQAKAQDCERCRPPHQCIEQRCLPPAPRAN